VAALSQRERDILAARFGLGGRVALTLEETGRELKLTRERIRQIEVAALKKMRAMLRRTS
jgi:RNA polymerase nonessential primary-like sigma factor